MRVYMHHARRISTPNQMGYCVKGMRTFCERHNLDFAEFARNGVEEEILLATGDAMAEMVVLEARKDG